MIGTGRLITGLPAARIVPTLRLLRSFTAAVCLCPDHDHRHHGNGGCISSLACLGTNNLCLLRPAVDDTESVVPSSVEDSRRPWAVMLW